MLGLQVAGTSACSRNPATGRLQFGLMSEDEEIALGRQSDARIRSSIGLYAEQPAVVELVRRVGRKISDATERPELPWTFRVLDDPSVNAFAVPGGYVYVTRGLLAHLNSEAELAAVLGHEAAHVTARHAAVQVRKQRTALSTVGLFRVIDPNLRHVGGIAAETAGLVLLKHSRDDENEADALGLRYVQRTGYDPAAIVEVFEVLAGVGSTSGRVPTWLSTHPQPESRRARMAQAIGSAADRDPEIDRGYLSVIEGIVHGKDPRKGFMRGSTYLHPQVGFAVDTPAKWTVQYDATGLVALSPDEEALFVLGPTEHESAHEALEAFFADPSVARGQAWEGEIGGVPMRSAAFALGQSPNRIAGLVGYLEFRERVLAMIAVGPEAGWAERADAVAAAFSSFRPLTDPAVLGIDAMRIRILELPSAMSLRHLQQARPSVVPTEDLARLNHVTADETMPAGRPVKRVEGFDPDATPPPWRGSASREVGRSSP